MKFTPVYLLFLLFIITGCHRRFGPTASQMAANKSANNNELTPLLNGNEAAGAPSAGTNSTITTPAPEAAVPIIIVDAKGNFAVTEKELPPDAPKSILNNANARAFTPAETKNLAYRFGKIPPRILYVPASLRKTTSRGIYYVLQKKYWYWKKADGYFYLDENYYQ